MNVIERYRKLADSREKLKSNFSLLSSQLTQALKQIDEINEEKRLLENSLQALKYAKPILSANSIEQCEKLANSALATIFETDATLKYSSEEGRFIIDEGDYSTDLKEGNGGGYLAVISLVFNLFLLMKLKKRRFLCFDEQFTQISDEYFENFMSFLKVLSKDLDVDILLVTHDKRIEDDMIDHLYVMEEGIARKIK